MVSSDTDINELPLDPPELVRTPGERTYTFLWGATDYVMSTAEHQRIAGVIAAIAAVGMIGMGVTALLLKEKFGWVGIGIGVCVAPLAFILLTRRVDAQEESVERRIRVCYDRRVVEFVECVFATGFVKTRRVDLYECPVDEIEGIDLFDPPDTSYRGGMLRIWTARGHLCVYGPSADVQPLHDALIALAGKRLPVFWRRQWFFYTVVFMVAGALAVVIFVYVL